jgi:hypothetical protein
VALDLIKNFLVAPVGGNASFNPSHTCSFSSTVADDRKPETAA